MLPALFDFMFVEITPQNWRYQLKLTWLVDQISSKKCPPPPPPTPTSPPLQTYTHYSTPPHPTPVLIKILALSFPSSKRFNIVVSAPDPAPHHPPPDTLRYFHFTVAHCHSCYQHFSSSSFVFTERKKRRYWSEKCVCDGFRRSEACWVFSINVSTRQKTSHKSRKKPALPIASQTRPWKTASQENARCLEG